MAEENNDKKLNRREFLKTFGAGVGSFVAISALEPFSSLANPTRWNNITNKLTISDDISMTYRINHHTNDKVSLLGYGMMRLPQKNRQIDQDMVNEEVDYALDHGVNYFDTAPVYSGGKSEIATGIALSRHPRDSYYIATKMSHQGGSDIEGAKQMYYSSLKNLKVDYIDYYLLHSVGGGGMEKFRKRFLDNGLLDFIVAERDAGKIRNLGFSYHGDVEVFDYLIDNADKYKFTFCQIEMNYLDWRHAKRDRKQDADAEYLCNKAEKAGIQCVVMEPLLGGRLARVSDDVVKKLKSFRPDDSPAKWAFRWVGSHSNILTTLSGMTTMEVLKENVSTFSPLDPCTTAENKMLEEVAISMAGVPVIGCTACRYCMPCPYGVDIPGNFAYYNEAVNKKLLPFSGENAKANRSQFQKGYKKAIDKKGWADKCMECEACLPKCPQQIRIPNQMSRIVELLNDKG